jgi:23S rRNA pseudouridine1911/1915/1917 synthase
MTALSGAETGQLQPVRQGEGGDTLAVTRHEAGLRLDHFLTRHYPDQSRSSLNRLIQSAHVLVNGQPVKAGYRLRPDELVSLVIPAPQPEELLPEQIDFPVLFEDEHLLVLSKPPGLVVHPASGHTRGTLVHGLLHHCRQLPTVDGGRPGIVHRLDKDTSGVMLVAKTEFTLRALMTDFKDRKIHKTYHALLLRSPRETQGRIVEPIGRHPVDRKKMAIRPADGRYAATSWRVVERFANGWCLAQLVIETGRTHQIRVHMASVNTPVAGDTVYGGAVSRDSLIVAARQMLHSSTICFHHPADGRELQFTAPLWADMQQVLAALRAL